MKKIILFLVLCFASSSFGTIIYSHFYPNMPLTLNLGSDANEWNLLEVNDVNIHNELRVWNDANIYGALSGLTELQVDTININGNIIQASGDIGFVSVGGNIIVSAAGSFTLSSIGAAILSPDDVIDFKPSDDNDDYIQLSTTGHQTTLNFVGQNGKITADSGTIDFDDESLTTTGGGSLTGTWTDLGTVSTIDIDGGTIDGVTIAGSAISGSSGSFTTLAASGATTLQGKTIIDVTSTEALLVRTNADGGDVFIVDTQTNMGIGINAAPGNNQVVRAYQPSGVGYQVIESGDDWVMFQLKGGQIGDVEWGIHGGFPAAGDLTFRVGGVANRMLIKSATGYVGIGEDSPQDRLEVNGTVLVKGKLKLTQDDGNEYITGENDNYVDIGATTAARFNSAVIVGGTTPDSLFEVDGAEGLAIETVTGNTTLDSTHSTLLVNASGNVTITLPTAASAYNNTDGIGRIYEVKKIDADADTVTIDGNGSEEIDGTTTAVITTQYESVTIQSNGTAWFII